MSPGGNDLGARVVLVQSVRFFWILWIRFALVAKDSLDWIWRTVFTVCAQRTSLPVRPFQRISRVGGGTANPARLVCCNTLKSA